MHEPLVSQLEEILQGRLTATQRAKVDDHLAACVGCKEELQAMSSFSGIVRSLRAPAVPDLRAGFYARVMQRVEAQGRPSFWNLLLDPVFGRRLVYGTGAMFLLMASFLLATTGDQPELAQTPVQIISQPSVTTVALPNGFGDDVQRDRAQFLATMASFSE
jgi:anti-sigma factor RsiW